MGVGYIQLFTTGNEYNIFNKEPNITFFKIYYRRHTNFFINNYEIDGNLIKNNEKITFKIPKNGDLLGKSYVRTRFEENYVELFKDYGTLYTSLSDNILNYYDSYSVRTESYNKDLIKTIDIVKIIFKNSDQSYLTILCTNILNTVKCIDLIKSTNGLNLETDINKIFYNINQYYK